VDNTEWIVLLILVGVIALYCLLGIFGYPARRP